MKPQQQIQFAKSQQQVVLVCPQTGSHWLQPSSLAAGAAAAAISGAAAAQQQAADCVSVGSCEEWSDAPPSLGPHR